MTTNSEHALEAGAERCELLLLKPFDLVTAPDDTYARPFLVVSNPYANRTLRHATTCLVMSRSTGKPETMVAVPGWTFVPKGVAGLTRDSLVTPTLRAHAIAAIATRMDELPPEFARPAFSDLQAALSLTLASVEPPVGFLKALPPPGLRHRGVSQFVTLYDTLKVTGWTFPRQGDILRAPPEFRSVLDCAWLVVSHTAFNRRYLYPQFTVVPLIPVEQSGYSAEDLRANNRAVVGPEVGLAEDRVAAEEYIRTYDIAQEWLEPCRRCYHPKTRNHWRFLLPAGPNVNLCIRCDRAPALWPETVGSIAHSMHRKTLEQVLRNVSMYLGS